MRKTVTDLVHKCCLLGADKQQRQQYGGGNARHLRASLAQVAIGQRAENRVGAWHNNAMSSKPHSGPAASHPKPGGKSAHKAKASGDNPPVWRHDDGTPVSCLEKIKVLNENFVELQQIAQDALEDALLIGCNESQMRQALHELVDALVNPYAAFSPRGEDESPKD